MAILEATYYRDINKELKNELVIYFLALSAERLDLTWPPSSVITDGQPELGSLAHWPRWWQGEVLTLRARKARNMNG